MYLKIKVKTNVAKSGFCKMLIDSGIIKVNIAAVPEKGKANRELIKLLVGEFKVDKDKIEIISGKSSRLKLVKIIK
ncbi:DUF167 domain-containing protein [Candidatus Parcubacteria bacterium]|nr:DUF167 domain-containing protein [Candidatus Parcubacteria bacterium]